MPPKSSARKKVFAETSSTAIKEAVSNKMSGSVGTRASSSVLGAGRSSLTKDEDVKQTENRMSTSGNSNKRLSTSIPETRVIKMPRILKSPPDVVETPSLAKKLSEDVGKEDTVSPRRSSRAVVPNTRYKDMVDPTTKAAGKQTAVGTMYCTYKEGFFCNLEQSVHHHEMMFPRQEQGFKKRESVPHTRGSVSAVYTASKVPQSDIHISNTAGQRSPVCEVLEEVVTEETNIDQDAQKQLIEQSEEMVQCDPLESESGGQSNIDFASKGTQSALVQSQKIIESIESGQFDTQECTTRKGLQHTIMAKQVTSAESSKPIPSSSANERSENSVIVVPSRETENFLKVSKQAGKEIVYQKVYKKGNYTVITIPKDDKLVKKTVAPVSQSSISKVAEHKHVVGKPQEQFVTKYAGNPEKTLVVTSLKSATVAMSDTAGRAGVRRKTPAILSAKIMSRVKPADLDARNSNQRQIQVIHFENTKKDQQVKKPAEAHKEQEFEESAAVRDITSSESGTVHDIISSESGTVHDITSSESGTVHDITYSESGTVSSASNGDITEAEREPTPTTPSESELNGEPRPEASVCKVSVEDGSAVRQVSETRLQSLQADVSSLCEVVEFKGKLNPKVAAKQPKSVVEFVMLNDQIIRISKPQPAMNKFGRIDHTPKSAGDGAVSRPGDIGTVIAGLGDVLAPVSKVQEAAGSDKEGTDVNKTAGFHGYVEHASKPASQELVEISHDAFTKEVYGDGYILDPVTGTVVAVDRSSPVETSAEDTGTGGGADGTLEPDDESIAVPSSAETIAGDVHTKTTESCSMNKKMSFQEPIVMDTGGFYVCLDCNFKSREKEDWILHRKKHQEGADNVDTTSWTNVTPASSVISGQVQYHGMDGSGNVICIEGLDPSQLGDNTRITVEKMASGGEAFILHIDPAGEAPGVQTGAFSGESTLVGGSNSMVHEVVKVTPVPMSKVSVPPVRALSNVKITPVRAYKGEETAVTKGTSITTQTEDSDTDSEEPIEVDLSEAAEGFPAVKRGRQSRDPHCQEYVIVHLPEGSDIKQYQARPLLKTQKPVDDAVTVDADGFYVCADCDHKTDKRSNWYKHRRKHLGIRPHACSKCSYRAATSSNLKRHMQIHDDIRNYECHQCGLHFRQKIHLERHLKYKHEEKKIVCPLCDYQCASANPDLKMHIRKRHMPLEGSMDAFTCDICGLMTVSKKDLKQHLKFHKKGPELKLFCEYCSFVTDCLSRLRRHLLVHTKERPFQCGLCQYRASQKEHVLRHMRSQHNVEVETRQKKTLLDIRTIVKDDNVIIPKDGDGQLIMSSKYKNFKGDVTDIVVKSDNLGQFEKSDFSSQEKIFACNHCSMKFARLINLYKHLYAQHESVMPNSATSGHQCVVCDFVTNSKKNLLVHMRKHNMQDHSPPTHVYSCVLCRYMNPKRRNLFQHMKKKHGIEIVMKEDGLNCFVTMEAESSLQGHTSTASEMPLSEIVTTEPISRDTALQVITDYNASLGADRISLDNIISMEEIGSYVTTQVDVHELVSPQSSFAGVQSSIQTHEAAEAIEGLQALAEQPGILETHSLDNELTTEIITTEILNDGEITLENSSVTSGNQEASSTGLENSFDSGEVGSLDHTRVFAMEQHGVGNEGFQNIGELAREAIGDDVQESSQGEGIELSAEELNQLSTGDYVEINGEVYKVEIASAPSGN